MSKLQDAARPVPFELICRIFCDEIGQVHAGEMRGPSHESITVKVQRPGVAKLIDEDLDLVAGRAEWAEAHTTLGRDYNLPALVEELAYTFRTELDYRREGHHAAPFRRNFAGDPSVRIPGVYRELSTSRVLTTERMSGIKIVSVAALDQAGINRHTVSENSVRVMLREIFEFGFFHADPHPGNFFVESDGSIALIDFGMIGRPDDRTQETLLRAGRASA